MYQFSGFAGTNDIVMHLSIDSVPQQHTVSMTRGHAGNFGLWQGSLKAGQHKVTLDDRATRITINTVFGDPEWR